MQPTWRATDSAHLCSPSAVQAGDFLAAEKISLNIRLHSHFVVGHAEEDDFGRADDDDMGLLDDDTIAEDELFGVETCGLQYPWL